MDKLFPIHKTKHSVHDKEQNTHTNRQTNVLLRVLRFGRALVMIEDQQSLIKKL